MSVPGTAAITKGPQKKGGKQSLQNEKTHTDFTDHTDAGTIYNFRPMSLEP